MAVEAWQLSMRFYVRVNLVEQFVHILGAQGLRPIRSVCLAVARYGHHEKFAGCGLHKVGCLFGSWLVWFVATKAPANTVPFGIEPEERKGSGAEYTRGAAPNTLTLSDSKNKKSCHNFKSQVQTRELENDDEFPSQITQWCAPILHAHTPPAHTPPAHLRRKLSTCDLAGPGWL